MLDYINFNKGLKIVFLMRDETIYRIEKFGTSHNGNYNFGVVVDFDYAKRALAKDFSPRGLENFQSIGRKIIDKSRLGLQIRKPYSFIAVNDRLTFLLDYVCVPGDACELNIDNRNFSELQEGTPLRKTVGYTSVNVDSLEQASVLLTNWLFWANMLR